MMEGKTYTVADFAENFNEDFTDEKFINENLKLKDYVSFLRKMEICDGIIQRSMFVNDEYIPNTPFLNLSLQMKLIDLYTTVGVNAKDVVGDYDILAASNLIDYLFMYVIPEEEITRFQEMMEQRLSDFYEEFGSEEK